jgi:putative peptide zinc metalloprotease protein
MFNRIKPIVVSMVPWKRSDPKVRVLKPWVRLVVTFWVLLVIPLLAFQVGMILLHAPRMFATAADSLATQADAVSKAIDAKNWLPAVGGVAQSLILVLPLLGLVLTFLRLGGRMSKKALTVTEGRPVSRVALGLVAVAAIGGLAYTWLPDGDYKPIRKGEKGTLTEGVAALEHIASGHPSLESRDKAAEAGRLAPVDGPVPTTVPVSTTLPKRGQSPVTSAPAKGSATNEPTPRSTTTTRVRSTSTTSAGNP